MKQLVITVFSLGMVMASCNSDGPISSDSAENPLLTFSATEAMLDIEESGRSAAKIPDTTLTAKVNDGRVFKVDVISEPIATPESRSQTREFTEFRLFGWLKNTVDGVSREIVYAKDAFTAKQSDVTWIPYAMAGNELTNYRWPGVGSKLAFLGVAPRLSNNNADRDQLAHQPVIDMVSDPATITVNMEQNYDVDLMIAACGVAGDAYIRNGDGPVKMKFRRLVSAVEVRVQAKLFPETSFRSVALHNIRCNGTYKFYHSRIFDLAYTEKIPNEAWTIEEGKSQVSTGIMKTKATGTVTDNSYFNLNDDNMLYVLPQEKSENAVLTFTFCNTADVKADGTVDNDKLRTASLKIPNLQFQQNQKYVFYVNAD